jgi:hypothetical protein
MKKLILVGTAIASLIPALPAIASMTSDPISASCTWVAPSKPAVKQPCEVVGYVNPVGGGVSVHITWNDGVQTKIYNKQYGGGSPNVWYLFGGEDRAQASGKYEFQRIIFPTKITIPGKGSIAIDFKYRGGSEPDPTPANFILSVRKDLAEDPSTAQLQIPDKSLLKMGHAWCGVLRDGTTLNNAYALINTAPQMNYSPSSIKLQRAIIGDAVWNLCDDQKFKLRSPDAR